MIYTEEFVFLLLSQAKSCWGNTYLMFVAVASVTVNVESEIHGNDGGIIANLVISKGR